MAIVREVTRFDAERAIKVYASENNLDRKIFKTSVGVAAVEKNIKGEIEVEWAESDIIVDFDEVRIRKALAKSTNEEGWL